MTLVHAAQLFTNRIFRVPDYQRGYAWEDNQLQDFWEDLQNLPEDRDHYTGVLTLEPVAKETWSTWSDDIWLISDRGFEPFFIVDGQQRLTTLVILVSCIVDKMGADNLDNINYEKIDEIRARYLTQTFSGDKIAKSYLLFYETDTTANHCIQTLIDGTGNLSPNSNDTIYTLNLKHAKEFFRTQLRNFTREELQTLYKKVTQKLGFDLNQLDDDLDVFVAFETINNRGKKLSSFELLKNRLIYLTTIVGARTPDSVQLRRRVSKVWGDIYSKLGLNARRPLEDDDFLKNHWQMFFGPAKGSADPHANFLLRQHFTAPRAARGDVRIVDISEYIASLHDSITPWCDIMDPARSTEPSEIRDSLLRLGRLKLGAFVPVVVAALLKVTDKSKIAQLLQEIERYIFLIFYFSFRRSDIGESKYLRYGHELFLGTIHVDAIIKSIKDDIEKYLDTEAFRRDISIKLSDGKGFYDWDGIRYFFMEYETYRQSLLSGAERVSWNSIQRAGTGSIEHILPQTATAPCWKNEFGHFSTTQLHMLQNSLGNLLLVRSARNSSFSNKCFDEKASPKQQNAIAYKNGSYSEMEIADYAKWSSTEILHRGLSLLEFLEMRWKITLGTEQYKKSLLFLDFV